MAEALLVIGIIGVVAAMTLPSLIQNHRNKQLESQFKKSYSMLSQSLLRVIAEDYDGNVTFNNSEFSNLLKYLSKYYKNASNKWPVLSDYPNSNSTERCMFLRNYYKNYNNSNANGSSYFNDGIINVTDGSTIYFDYSSSGEVMYGLIFIALDINGWRNKPNRYGYDLFAFQLASNGKLIPMGSEITAFPEEEYCSNNSSSYINGFGCTRKAITDSKYFNKLKW